MLCFPELTECAGNGAVVYLFVSAELSLGIICGCIASTRPLMSKLWPGLAPQEITAKSNPSASGNTSNDKLSRGTTTSAKRAGFRDLQSIEESDIELGEHD